MASVTLATVGESFALIFALYLVLLTSVICTIK